MVVAFSLFISTPVSTVSLCVLLANAPTSPSICLFVRWPSDHSVDNERLSCWIAPAIQVELIYLLLPLASLDQERMNGPEVDSQLAQLQQQPFHVTEELLPALLGKLVKLVQENDIKTDADMDKTIDKAAGEVLEEAKAEPKEKTDSGEKEETEKK